MFRGKGRGGSGVNGPPSGRTMWLKKKVSVEVVAKPAKSPGSLSSQESPRGKPSPPSSSSVSPVGSPRGVSPPGSPSSRAPQNDRKSEQVPQDQGDQVPEVLVAYFLFERENDGFVRLVFCSSDTVFVIDKVKVLREGKFLISSLVKGAPFLMTPSSSPWTSVSIFRNFKHVSIDSFSNLQSQDFGSIPEVLCRVSPSVNDRQAVASRNFQFMPDTIKAFNIQIPDAVLPESLVCVDPVWAKVKFLPKAVYRKNGTLVKYPSVVKGSFRFCDQRGEDIPRTPPTRTFSADTIAALKRGLGANLIVGGSSVSFSDSGCLVVSDWAMEDFGFDSTTSIEELLNAVSVQASASDHQSGYFKAHFGRLSNNALAQSGSQPTILFIPGFSNALTFRTAEALAVRAARAGCRALVVASSSIASTDVNFSEVNSPRANEAHTSTLYKINQPVQLGVLNGDGYDFENPSCATSLFAYDILECSSPNVERFSDSLSYPVVEVDLEGVPVFDVSYLSNPKTKFALVINATPGAVNFSRLKSKLLGSFLFDNDVTGRSDRLASLKAFLPSEKAREDVIEHLKRFDGATSMKPEESNPSVSKTSSLATIKLLYGDLSISHTITFLVGLGCSSDSMFFLSNDTLRVRLPPKDNLHSFVAKCRAVNRSLSKPFFRLLHGEDGPFDLVRLLAEDLADPPDQGPLALTPFVVQGHTADLDADSVLTMVRDTGG